MSKIERLLSQVPPALRGDVERYLEALLQAPANRRTKGFDFAWSGALRHLRDSYTSVELQHKIRDWWAG